MTNVAIFAEIIGKDSLSAAANSAASSLGGLESAGNRANSMLGGLASSMAHAAATVGAITFGGVVAGLGAATTAAMGFEKTMSGIGAVSGLDQTGEQFKSLSKLALQLGADTSFSASEAAAGMGEMVKAGVSVEAIMQGAARATLDLAAAGGVDVAEAATIASNAMNTFSKSGADMAHIADLLAGAANASAIDVHELGFSLSAVGSVAATVGLSIEDTATSIAVLGQAGLRGSDAGTSLKTMLLSLQPSTEKQTALFRELGLITADGANQFFTAAGSAKSMGEIAGVLQSKLGGLTEQERLMKLELLFGTDAIRAAAIMTKTGAAGFDEMAASIGKVSAQTVANERLNNLAGSIEKLKGSLETAAITLGMRFTPGLKILADRATEAVNTATPLIEVYGDKLAGAFDTASKTLDSLGSYFREVAVDGDYLNDFLADLPPSIQGGVEALGRMVAKLVDAKHWLDENWDAIQQAIRGERAFADVLQNRVGWALDYMVVRGTEAVTFFQDHWQPILVGAAGVVGVAMVASARASIAAWIPVALPIIAVGTAIAILYDAWQRNLGGMQERTETFYDETIVPTFGGLQDWLADKLPAAFDWLTTTGWPMLLDAGQQFIGWVQETGIPAVQSLAGWLGEKLAGGIGLATAAWPMLLDLGGRFASLLTGTVIPNLERFGDLMGRVFGRMASGDVVGGLGVFIDAVLQMFKDFGATVQRVIGEQVARINWADVWTNARGIISSLADTIIGTGLSLAGALGGWLKGQVATIDWPTVWGDIRSKVSLLADTIISTGTDLGTRLGAWLSEQWGIAWAAIKAGPQGSLAQQVEDSVKQIPGILDNIRTKGQEFIDWVLTMNQTLSDLGVYTNLADAFKQIGYGFDVIGAAFRDNGPAVQSTIDGLEPSSATLATTIRDLSAGFRDFGNWFRSNSPAIRDALLSIGGAFQTLKDYGPSVVGVVLSLGAAFAALKLVGTVSSIVAVATAMSPLGLIIGGVVLAVGLLATAWVNNWGDIQGKTSAAVAFIKGQFDQAVQDWNVITTWLGQLSTDFATKLNEIAANIDTWNTERTAAWNTWHEERTTAWNAFWTGLGTAWDTWNSERTAAWNGFLDGIKAGWDTWNQERTTAWNDFWNTLWSRTGEAWNAIYEIIRQNWESISTNARDMMRDIGQGISDGWNEVWKRAGEAWNAIWDITRQWWEAIFKTSADTLGGIRDQIAGSVGDMGSAAGDLGKSIYDGILGWVGKVVGAVGDVLGKVKGMLPGGGGGAAPEATPSSPSAGGLSGGVTGVDTTGYWQQRAADIAKSVGLDPNLFMSQIQQESGYAEDVISGQRRSSAGALGIAQIMPGTAADWGVDPLIPEDALQAAAQHMKEYIDNYMRETGGDYVRSVEMALAAYNAGGGNLARYGLEGVKDPSFAGGQTRDYIELIKGRLQPPTAPEPAPMALPTAGFTPQNSQFLASDMGLLTFSEARAACGPAALSWFMERTGRLPDGQEAQTIANITRTAQAAGQWDPAVGMHGAGSFQAMAAAQGIQTEVDYTPTREEATALGQAGSPFVTSHSGGSIGGHYFQVSGMNEEGKYNVGASGTSLVGGAEFMSLEEMEALAGPMNAIITLSAQMGNAMTTAGDQFGTATGVMADSLAPLGDGVTTTTDAMATGFDEFGNAISGLPDVVAEPIAGAVEAIDPLNNSLLTIGASGEAMASVIGESTAGMQEQATDAVTSMAEDTIAGAADMNTGVVDAVSTMTDGSMELMDAMSATVVDSADTMGANTSDAVSQMGDTVSSTIDDMGSQVINSADAMGSQVTEAAGTMGDEVTGAAESMGDQVIGAAESMGNDVAAAADSMSGSAQDAADQMQDGVTSAAEDMAGDSIGSADTMSSEIQDILSDLAGEASDLGSDIGDSLADGLSEGFDDAVAEVRRSAAKIIKEAEEAANAAAQIASPSKVFARIGRYLTLGVAEGIEDGLPMVEAAARELVEIPANVEMPPGLALDQAYGGQVYAAGGDGGIDYERLAAALKQQPITIEIDRRVLGEVVAAERNQVSRRNGGRVLL